MSNLESRKRLGKYLALGAVLAAAMAMTASARAGGWDYDLKTQCAKDVTGNVVAGAGNCATSRRWTVTTQSEWGFNANQQCPYGSTNKAFTINGGGPATMGWYAHTSDLGPNWTVNMKMDNVDPNSNTACVDGYFNAYLFKDDAEFNGYSPAYLPDPSQLVSSHLLAYNDFLSNAQSASRMMLGAEVWWDNVLHIVEIDVFRSGNAYNVPVDSHGVLLAVKQPSLGREYVVLDGPSWGISATKGQVAQVFVPWKDVFAVLRNYGYFTQINNSSAASYKTKSVYIGTETYGRAIGDLWQTNFRIAP